jgi:ESX secretion-associated protein EspG
VALQQRLTLPAERLARLVELENIGELHVALRPLAVWRPQKDREALDRAIRDELAAMGLVDRRGRLDVELESSLAVVCRPKTEFYGWIQRGDRTIGVLAAAIGKEGVLAVRDGDEVRLRQVGTKNLAEALARQTAEVPPGKGDTISFVQSEAVAAVDGRRTSEVGARTEAASREIRLAQRIASQPTVGGGQLSVACRDTMGRRRASEHPLRYADTAHGRWLNMTATLPGGDNRILLTPASQSDLAARLREMHHALTH